MLPVVTLNLAKLVNFKKNQSEQIREKNVSVNVTCRTILVSHFPPSGPPVVDFINTKAVESDE